MTEASEIGVIVASTAGISFLLGFFAGLYVRLRYKRRSVDEVYVREY